MKEERPMIYRNLASKRPKPGPASKVPRSKFRDRCITGAFNDEDVKAIDAFRARFPFKPTRSSFLVHVVRQFIEQNRRRDVPGIVPKL